MSRAYPRSVVKRTYIALQIPGQGKIWVEAGPFKSFSEAFDAFERNDTNTLVFSIPELVTLVGKILTALNALSMEKP